MDRSAYRIPRSISHWVDPFVIVFLAILTYIALRTTGISDLFLAIVIVLVIGAVMGLVEFLRAPWSPLRHAEPLPARPFQEAVSETGLQWLGMLTNFLIILFLWWAIAEYYRDYYAPFFAMLPLLMVGAPILTALILFATEKFCGPAKRGGREIGLLVARACTGSFQKAFSSANWTVVRDELLSWILFGFFLPLNFVELVKTIGVIRGQEMVIFSDDWVKAQYFIIMMIYGLIIASITPGYLFGSRLIRTETRAVDHSWFGWTITLICYDPIVTAVFGRWFDYRAPMEGPLWMRPWATTFHDAPTILLAVGVIIIFCEMMHLWGEAQFGLRSSNISNRGVITAGLYRLTKHPVYVSKCAGWLLMWVPFLAGGTFTANLRLTILWGGVCIIYALRAVAEERVLAKDPDYVQYALHMDKHGMFAWVGKYLPFMTFKYRMEKWQGETVIPLPEETPPQPVIAIPI